jgi:hypothetical protein
MPVGRLSNKEKKMERYWITYISLEDDMVYVDSVKTEDELEEFLKGRIDLLSIVKGIRYEPSYKLLLTEMKEAAEKEEIVKELSCDE